jgi:putative endopeptidase
MQATGVRYGLCAVVLLTATLAAQAPPRPQDDLFRHANDTWLRDTPIPDDRVTYSAATELVDRVEHQLRTLIEGLQHGPDLPRGTEGRLIADLYRSVVNRAALESIGLAPIREDLDRLAGITSVRDASALAGRLSVNSEGGPFDVTLVAASRRASRNVARVTAGGLLLPDWSYYLSPSPQSLDIRRAYGAYLSRLFAAAGQSLDEADSAAGRVIAFEIAMAQALRDVATGAASPRVWSLSEIERAMPGFGWRQWAQPQGLDRAGGIMLDQPEFFRAFSALVGRTPPSTLAAWLRARFLTSLAPYLPEAFASARFDFFGRRLTGQVAPREPWKRGVSMVSEFLGDAIGRRYVAAHFPAPARDRVRDMVTQILTAAREAVQQSEWMTSGDRDAAVRRLATMDVKVGYPDHWRIYAGLKIDPGDLIGNVRRLRAFDMQYRMQRARVAQSSLEWLMAAHVVNAYYSPAQHEIVLPAGILQPPYFDAAADDGWNYGAIGAVIGHEISHALDLRGAAARARGLHQQFSAFEVVPGVRLNADLTFAEALADVIGLQLAHRAYRQSAGGRAAPVLDGMTGDQRFFFGWARMWRGQSRPDYLRYTNETSPHAPPQFRANGTAAHVEAFYSAFGVSPGDGLYRPPEARVRVW